ncbi:MAG: beta-lactamase family protein [Bryobacterales bacterium]|nr:beta-lactamase family protein [Bryobacterales bacterium]
MVWAEGFGFADVRSGAVVTPEHRFRIGTVSMALTSAAVGRLVEEGRLGWEDEIGKHVAAFPRKQWPVTLRQLMGHTAGVGGDDGEQAMIRKRCGTPGRGAGVRGESAAI